MSIRPGVRILLVTLTIWMVSSSTSGGSVGLISLLIETMRSFLMRRDESRWTSTVEEVGLKVTIVPPWRRIASCAALWAA